MSSDLDDALRLEHTASAPGATPLASPIRPTVSGLNWVAAPSSSSTTGLVYRIQGGTTLECISFFMSENNDDEEDNMTVLTSIDIGLFVAVQIATSFDGRLVAVACADGSLHCYDSLSTTGTSGLKMRWMVANAHSHIAKADISTSLSSSRARAAAAAGPIRSLAFCGYYLLLVDDGRLAIYNAASAVPVDTLKNTNSTISYVASAAWSSSSISSISRSDNKTITSLTLVVGGADGSISVCTYHTDSGTLQTSAQLAFPGDGDDQDGWSCTHLDWSGTTLVAGLCRVIPSEEEEDSDEDDEEENDAADHQANLFVTTIDLATLDITEWEPQGDVVPFWSVPRHGRHVFFTSILSSGTSGSFPVLIVVASNVASDIGVLAKTDNGWSPVEFQEGNAATTPTNEEDDFYFPVGISVVVTPTGPIRLVLGTTDGSLSTFQFIHDRDPAMFTLNGVSGPTVLPNVAVQLDNLGPESESELANQPLAALASAAAVAMTTTTTLFGAVGGAAPPSFSFTPSPKTAPASGSIFDSGIVASGGQQTSSAFGSGSSSGLTFGSGTGTNAFGIAGSSMFGSPTTGTAPGAEIPALGASVSSSSSSNAAVFGSTTSSYRPVSSAAVGFAALATSPPVNTFNAFEKSTVTPSSSVPSSMMKPLFGTATTTATAATATPSSKKEETTTAPSPFSTFGSGTSTLSFGSQTKSSGGFGAIAAAAAPATPSPFSAFGSSSTSSSIPSSMVKPLFGTSKSPEPAAAPAKKQDLIESSPVVTVATEKATVTEPTSASANSAARVFDEFDMDKAGALPISMFEDMTDELGEGFHGDEYDAQLASIDPSGSGEIRRASFIDWYTTLVEGGGQAGDGDDSLDSEEIAEREEEKEKATKAFSALASADGTIHVDGFGELIESLGTTYCEEEHVRTLKNLKQPGDLIRQSDFVAWYIGWLFGGDESEEEYDDDEEYEGGAKKDETLAFGSNETAAGWGNLFSVDKDSWKCAVCSVRNPDDLNLCSACETMRPGFEDVAEKSKMNSSSQVSSGSGIGAGGFSFGGGSIGSGGFSFGAPAATTTGEGGATTEKAAVAPFGGGLSFGVPATPMAKDEAKGEDSTAPAPGGFSFGTSSGAAAGFSFGAAVSSTLSAETPHKKKQGPAPTSASTNSAARVFDEFDTDKAGALPIFMFEDMTDELGEGFHGDEYDAQLASIDPSGSGEIRRASFIDWYTTLVEGGGQAGDGDDSLDSEEIAEREEEKEKATKAFSALASADGTIHVDGFGELIESLGTTYCEEEHVRTLKNLKQPGDLIRQSDFVAWYIGWLFGGDESEEEYDDDEEYEGGAKKDETLAFGSNETAAGWGNLFSVDKDSWKCAVCSVRNPDDLNLCSACETMRPGFEDVAEKSKMNSSSQVSSGSGIGAGGFSFGGGSIGSGGFSFGAPAATTTGEGGATTEKAAVAPFGGGLSFGVPATPMAKDEAKGEDSTAPAPGGFSFGTSSGAATGFSFGVAASSTQKSDASDVKSIAMASSGSFHPPVSSKAPTPFSAVNETKPKEPAANSSYPPLSSIAPTPFGEAKSSKPSSGGYPPLSLKAPTPFGAKPKEPVTASSSYPPLSSTAPTPFGAAQPSKPTSGGYPPMSSNAPTPFGTKPKEPAANSSYPPLSSTAPTPFGAAQPSKPTSGGYPPMSSNAPTPFGAKLKEPAANSSYPPLSSTAPTPFGAAKSSRPSSGGYPPMSSNAPTPFGTKPKEPAANSSYPPLSSTAPTPFGAAQPSKPSSGGYPSMSSNAPTSFGAKPKEPAASSSYSPLSSTAPTPFEAAQPSNPSKAPTLFGTSQPTSAEQTKSTQGGMKLITGRDTKSLPEVEVRFAALVRNMDSTLVQVSGLQEATDPNKFDKRIEKLVGSIQVFRLACIDIDAALSKQSQENAFLLSRKTDASRQTNEARRLIDEHLIQKGKGASNVAETQPLDFESEQRRRSYAASAMQVSGQIKRVNESAKMLESSCSSTKAGTTALLTSLMDCYKKSRAFEQTLFRIDSKITASSRSIPMQLPAAPGSKNETPKGRSTYGLTSPSTSSKREKLRPLPIPAVFSSPNSNRVLKDNNFSLETEKWRSIEYSLQNLGSERTKTIKLGGVSTLKALSTPTFEQNTTVRKDRGTSLLLSPQPAQTTFEGSYSGNTTSVALFSPPSATKSRSAWDRPSSVDQSRAKQMSLSTPRDLKEVTVADASRAALAAYGTTPEKVKASLEVKKSEGAVKSPIRQSRSPLPSSSEGQDRNGKNSSSVAFPPLPTKAPTPFSQNVGVASGSTPKDEIASSHPLIPETAPKPFSGLSAASTGRLTPSKKEEPTTPEVKKDPNVSLGKTSSGGDKAGASVFGGITNLGDSLFSLAGKTDSKPSDSSFGFKSASSHPQGLTSTSGSSGLDFKQVLTSFYQKHNPSKLGEVDKTLEKFKVSFPPLQ
jgi:Ca2+-binding EF-hand superfamily protein/uncharacterized membrane protein YgcG